MSDTVKEHASERCFILKSIIIDNLYGVDLMEEAGEICKLRLFLKLVAQPDGYDPIEPLPDIDCNVRAGNTRVGVTSPDEIRKAFTMTSGGQRRMLYAEDEDQLRRIEENAELADRAFHQFRAMQTKHGMDAGAFTDTKSDRRKRLDDLQNESDDYAAGDDGVKTDDDAAYQQWQDSHQPFHCLESQREPWPLLMTRAAAGKETRQPTRLWGVAPGVLRKTRLAPWEDHRPWTTCEGRDRDSIAFCIISRSRCCIPYPDYV